MRGAEAPPNFWHFYVKCIANTYSTQHTTAYDMQGWQSRSGRPGNRRTNVLTEMMLLKLVGEIHAYRKHKFVPAQTSRSESKRELQRPENKQIVSGVAMHTFFTGIARSNKILTGFHAPLFVRFQKKSATTALNLCDLSCTVLCP